MKHNVPTIRRSRSSEHQRQAVDTRYVLHATLCALSKRYGVALTIKFVLSSPAALFTRTPSSQLPSIENSSPWA